MKSLTLLGCGVKCPITVGNMKRLPYKTFQNITQFSGNCFILLVIAS